MLLQQQTSLTLMAIFLLLVNPSIAFVSPAHTFFSTKSTTTIFAVGPLQPAAILLMDSGKALARSGELIIELTTELDLYGGALSSTGALVRNAGDCIAQAAASSRFKTAMELVCDELREAATCLSEGALQMERAREEQQISNSDAIIIMDATSATCLQKTGIALEGAGKSILQRDTVPVIGQYLMDAAVELEELSKQILRISSMSSTCQLASQRMAFGAERMKEAGNVLIGAGPEVASKKGKQWIKA